jgi:hypothetical protein
MYLHTIPIIRRIQGLELYYYIFITVHLLRKLVVYYSYVYSTGFMDKKNGQET